MKFRHLLAAFVALVGVLGLSGAALASGTASPSGSTSTEAQDNSVQDTIDQIVAADASAEQVSSNVVEIDGVTIAIAGSGDAPSASGAADYTCHYKRLCTWHNGKFDEWFYCERVWLSNWTGNGWAINNQTPDTTSHFYNQDGSRNFSLKDGYYVNFNWDPIWSFQVC